MAAGTSVGNLGLPQWANLIAWTYASAGAGGSVNESDVAHTNGLQALSGSMFTETGASHIIDAAPTTTSPILIELNGVSYWAPYNQSAVLPPAVWNVLAVASTAGFHFT